MSSQQTIVIVGGTARVGRPLAQKLADRGDEVFITGRDQVRAQVSFPKMSSGLNSRREAELSLHKDAPLGRAVQRCGTIVATPVLSGLHHRYVRI